VTREEIIAKLATLVPESQRARLDKIDDVTPLFTSGLYLEHVAMIDLIAWLMRRLGWTIGSQLSDINEGDLDSIRAILALADRLA
jgi:hypothetical protein